ncbi:glycosyltransferase [Promicromonospora sp. MEB111]|uniref:glycosyltransferase n=1 Tax=Promicromonospora sp. MEB111 TaxID=3040301 RepID=UPI00254DFA79|nr:glycosyltransferase [Promicromonospora sp. MEB111]
MIQRNGLRVLSLYEGFFSGGARVLHSTVVAGLHQGGRQQHSVLSLHHEVRREATLQRMEDDPRYRALRAAGVRIGSLGRSTDANHDPRVFSEAELRAAAHQAEGSHVILSLKEQPLRLVNQDAFPQRPVIACLHRSDPEHQGDALGDLLTAAERGRLAAVVCCAESTRDAYREAGVPAELLRVVPNGINLARFRPVQGARRLALRGAAGIPADATVVVYAARYDEMKNPELFLRSARLFLAMEPHGRVLMCGAGMSSANPDLAADLERIFGDRPDLLERLDLLGVRHDMELVYATADVVALTSTFGEAAPLCLIEGSMCGAVPVTTPVGDAPSIVERIGFVTSFDPDEIASTWIEAAARREELESARTAVRPRFSHVRMIAGYSSIIERTHRDAGLRMARV